MSETSEIHVVRVSRSKLYSALCDYTRRCDSQQAHHAVRVSAEGDVYVTTDAGWSMSEGEWHRQMPHTVTVLHAAGAGQCDIPEDGEVDPDGWLCDEVVDECIGKLEEAGYEVVIDE